MRAIVPYFLDTFWSDGTFGDRCFVLILSCSALPWQAVGSGHPAKVLSVRQGRHVAGKARAGTWTGVWGIPAYGYLESFTSMWWNCVTETHCTRFIFLYKDFAFFCWPNNRKHIRSSCICSVGLLVSGSVSCFFSSSIQYTHTKDSFFFLLREVSHVHRMSVVWHARFPAWTLWGS